MGARETCVFSRVHEIVVLNHKDTLLGRNPAGGVGRGPVLAARRDHAEESHPEALGQQIVNDGVHGRAQIEENTYKNEGRGVGRGRERPHVLWNNLRRGKYLHVLYCSTKLGCKGGGSDSMSLPAATQEEGEGCLAKAGSGTTAHRENGREY